MADLPHLGWPYRLGAVVEQDSPQELLASAAVIACTPRGQRDDNPAFGVTTPLFEQRPVDTRRLAAEISRSDPRLNPSVEEAAGLRDAMTAQLRVDIEGQP